MNINTEKTYEEYKKFKPMLEEIKKLGYVEPENKNVFQYIVDDDIEEKPTDTLLLTLKRVTRLITVNLNQKN